MPAIGRTWHGARRTWLTLLFVPVFVAVLLAEAAREIAYWFRRHQADEYSAHAHFRRPSAMPRDRAQRSVADIVANLERIPHDPLGLSTHIAFYREFGAEGLGVLFSSEPALSSLPHIYPGMFKPRLLTGYDGVQLAGMQAMHRSPGPALILCHGLLTNKNFDYIRQLAKRAYSNWGFHVVTVDLRSWGQSAWTSDAPSSCGYFEGKDVVEIACALHQDRRVTSVGVIGFSLGACTVLNAARHASDEDESVLDGGVFAVSAPTDVARAVEYISHRPHWRHPFFGLYVVYRTALRAGVRKLGLDPSMNDWGKLLETHAMPWYGLDDTVEFTGRASAKNFAGQITVPTLELHAADDFVVPVDHAYALRDAAVDNPNVHVWVVDRGNHCAFTAVDQRWFYSVVRRWFEYWANEPD